MSIDMIGEGVTRARGESDLLSPTRRARRDRLLSTAVEQFLREGYHGTTMEGIAAEAGVSKVTLYKYFTDKDELFLTLVEEGLLGPDPELLQRSLDLLTHLFALLAADTGVAEIEHAILGLFDLAAERRNDAFFRLMIEVGFEQPAIALRAKELALGPRIQSVLAAASPTLDAKLPPGLDTEVLSNLLFAAVTGYTVVQPAVLGEERPGPDRLAAALAYLLCHGLRTSGADSPS